MLNPRSLEVFVAVAEKGSFSAAAHELWCTQSAISQQIQALERRLGGQVFLRGTRPVQVTAMGAVLLDRARDILARLRDAEQEAVQAGQQERRLRLASFATGSATLVQAALAQPDPLRQGQLEVVIADPQQSLASLEARTVDVALVFDYGTELDPPLGVTVAHIVNEPMLVAVSSGHKLAFQTGMTLHQLRGLPWVSGKNPLCQEALRSACAKAGFDPRVVHRTDDYDAALAVVTTSDCATLVPRVLVTHLPAGVRTLALPGELPERKVRAAWSASGAPLRNPAGFVTALRSLLADDSAADVA